MVSTADAPPTLLTTVGLVLLASACSAEPPHVRPQSHSITVVQVETHALRTAPSVAVAAPRAQVRYLAESQCIDVDLGGPYSCVAEREWIERANASCEARGLELLGFAVTNPCGDGWFRYVEGACCPTGWSEPDNVTASTAARVDEMLSGTAPNL